MSETWVPTTTTPGGRAAGMRQLSRLTAGLSIGAVAATGATAAVVGVDQLLSHGTNVLSLLLGDADSGSAQVVPIAPAAAQQAPVAPPAAQAAAPAAPTVVAQQAAPAAPVGGTSGAVQIAPPSGTRAHATTGGS